MTFLLTIVIFAAIITLLVFIHELGHFMAAKISGVKVDEFGIGFGPTLIKKSYRGTLYKINLLPLGGYVQLEGESSQELQGGLRSKRLRIKAFVLMAGIVMNLILAIILLGIYLSNNGFRFAIPNLVDHSFSNVSTQEVLFPLIVTEVAPNGASNGILQERDVIVKLNNSAFNSTKDFLDKLKELQGEKVSLSLMNFDTFEITQKEIVLPLADDKGSILNIGIVAYDSQSNRSTYFLKYNQNIFAGMSMTYDVFVYQFKALGSIIGNALSSGNYQEVSNSVGGLPSIGNQVGQLVEFQEFDILIPLTALFSVNLAMFNILPFPALDGGQLLFAIIEKARRKKFSDDFLNKINFFGFVFLMTLGLLVTFKDIIQLKWIESILKFVGSIFGR